MQQESILIDRLEDQIIDHPDARTKQEVDGNLDEAFQKRLNERAEQLNGDLGSDGVPFLVTKRVLDYTYREYGPLHEELNEWFAYNDIKGLRLGELAKTPDHDLAHLVSRMDGPVDALRLDELLYFAFGAYKNLTAVDEQVAGIKQYGRRLHRLGLYAKVALYIKRFIREQIAADKTDDSDEFVGVSPNFFKLLTLMYFGVCVHLEEPLDGFRDMLLSSDVLSEIVRFVEHWRWHANPFYRVRSLILLTWKLLLVEFGTLSHLEQTDNFLKSIHGIKEKDDKHLACSPLDYFTFRENLMDKFPLYGETPFNVSDLKEALPPSRNPSCTLLDSHQYFMAVSEYSNSLSNLLESPRPNKTHLVLSLHPVQTVHIATPVPLPRMKAPEFMSGGEKVKRMYHVNQAMPLIYPTEEGAIPQAIKEADDIFRASVYESYSVKRLWAEREKFMVQERGHQSEYAPDDIDYEHLLAQHPEHEPQITSLLRVELFYRTNFPRLHSFLHVLVETIKSNKFDTNLQFAEMELNPDTSYIKRMAGDIRDPTLEKIEYVIKQQLEVQLIKEITLKASSSILVLFLRWFKANHVLKYYYVSSILFDQQFFSVFVEYLNRSFNNTNLQIKDSELSEYELLTTQNRLMNPKISLPPFEFFTNCLDLDTEPTYSFINKTTLNSLPVVIDETKVKTTTIHEFNANYCHIVTNLLNVTNKILIKNVTQRIFILNESKPTELFKVILLNYTNPHMQTPILKILKKLIPYQGRKWKSVNMDLISLIYLNLRLSLKDNWLSGRDVENDFNNSFDQEIALRSLLQFYNMRRYPDQMKSLGYQVSTDEIPILDLNQEEWY